MAGKEQKTPLQELVTAVQRRDSAGALHAAQTGYAAFLGGEMNLQDPIVDPNMEWIPPEHGPTAGTYQGLEGAAEEVDAWSEPFDDFKWEPKEVLLGEDRFVVVGRMSGRGRTSGLDIQMDEFHVWTLRDGLIVRMQMFMDRHDALAAAGLTAPG